MKLEEEKRRKAREEAVLITHVLTLSAGNGEVVLPGGHRGMPRWVVTEPEVNLWLLDNPMSYQPSRGPAVDLRLYYKDDAGSMGEFSTTDGVTFGLVDTNVFTIGWRWSFNWRAWVETESQQGSDVSLHTSEGRTIAYTLDEIEYNTQTTLSLDSANNRYTLTYPDGAKDYYGVVAFGGTNYGALVQGTNMAGSVHYRYFIGRRDDPHGNGLKFHYLTNSPVKLDYVVDVDNRATTFSYYAAGNTNFAALVWKITDPATTNVVEFKYAANGCLTNIIDAAGIESWLAYDTEKSVSSLVTPYGTTTFQFPISLSFRAIRITEPNGAHHLWVSGRQFNSELVPAEYDDSEVPKTTNQGYFDFANTFNNNLLNTYNSLYWGPRQYVLLSTDVLSLLNSNDPSFSNELTAGDYGAGRMRHWLKDSDGAWSLTLSLEREPSPDGTTAGVKVWYDYEGKPDGYPEQQGTMRWPRCVAVRSPGSGNGESTFTWFVRNSLGHPDQVIDTYTGSGDLWKTRTNWFKYSTDGVDLIAHTNALGKLVSSNLHNATWRRVATNWNALNEMTVYAVNSKGQVTNISRPSGLNIASSYLSSGTYTDWLEKIVDYEIVSNTNKYYRTNAFTYSAGRIYTFTDPRGLVVTNFWDGLGRLTGTADPRGSTTNKYYLLSSNAYANSTGGTNILDLTAEQDHNELWTYYVYDSIRLLSAVTNANTNLTQYQHCDCGVLESVTTAMTNVTHYEYDNAGRIVKTVNPNGLSVTNSYNAIGRVAQVADSYWYTVYGYNNQGLVTVVSNAVGKVSGAVYDILDQLSSQTDANGVTTSFTYDDLIRLATRLISGTATETFNYNPRGLTNYVDPLGTNTWYVYDALGRLIAQTNGNAEVIQFAYLPAGDLATLTDGRQKQTTWGYDQYGRVTNKVDANSIEIFRYQYDPGNRLTNRWSKAKGNTRYEYDSVANLTKVTYEANTNGLGTNVLSFAYDKDNWLTSMVDGVGASAYTYANGLLASEDGPWVGDTVSYAYATGLRQSLTLLQPNASAWQESYGFDGGLRLTNVTSPAGVFGYTYAGPGSLVTNLALPSGMAITSCYDSVGRLTGTWLRASDGTILNGHQYNYNVASQRTKQTRTAGDYVDYTYDGIGQLRAAQGKESGGTSRLHEQMGYGYDAGGNLSYRTNNTLAAEPLVQAFSVDNVNQLTSVSRTGKLTVAGGNSSSASSVTVNGQAANRYSDNTFAKEGLTLTGGADTFTAVANDAYGRADTNAVTVSIPSSVSFVYDDNGNLLSDGSRGFAYDAENQLVQVTVTNNWRSEFVYDGFGRRRVRTEYVWQNSAWVPQTVVRYLYDELLVVQERDGNNVPLATYSRGRDLSGSRQRAGGIGGLLARTDNAVLTTGASGAHAYYHADANGNITLLVTDKSTVGARYLYDPFGDLLASAGPLAGANLYRFSSKEVHTASGLYYYGFRFYDPILQRWVTRDPLEDPVDVNPYRFSDNTPTVDIDPFGLKTVACTSTLREFWNILSDPDGYTACYARCMMLGTSVEVAGDFASYPAARFYWTNKYPKWFKAGGKYSKVLVPRVARRFSFFVTFLIAPYDIYHCYRECKDRSS